MDQKLEEKLFQTVEKNTEWAKSVRHELHQYPELDFELPKTIALISSYLDAIPGVVYRKAVGGSAIIADIEGKDKTKTIALRADIDALPILEASGCPFPSKHKGNMHACGHDVHATIVIAVLKNLSEHREDLPCNVRVLFQPAEETTGGALPLIKEGALEGVSYIYGLHVDVAKEVGQVGYEYGAMYASSTDANFKITGKSGHGAYPSLAVDAVVVAASVVTALQSVVSRTTDARDALVLTFGTVNGGTKENIIAQEVFLKGTMRSLTEEVKETAKKRITALVEDIAAGFGAKGEVYLNDNYISLINHDECVDIVKANAIHLLGAENVLEEKVPNMGVEDFAYYVKEIPGAFWHLGVRNEELGIVESIHNDKFNVDEDAIAIGVKMGILNIFQTYEKLLSK
ncbi:MAG: amidohydrolase [Fusobacteriaceae bacterium]|nr:amidohydrolase [Fusobacteriaceae bacterium]